MAKKTEKPTSIASVLRKVKLPSVVFHVARDYRITRLENLRFEDSKAGTCECDVVCGEEYVVGLTDKDGHYCNRHKVAMKECYPTISEALKAIALSERCRERAKFKSPYCRYNCNQSVKIGLLKQYPELVLTKLTEEYVIEEGSVTADTLKLTHFREATQFFDELLVQIVNLKFPDLADSEGEEEDE